MVQKRRRYFATKAVRLSLSSRLTLEDLDWMQDWPLEVADSERIPEFLAAYHSGLLGDDEKFVLMELLMYSLEYCEPESAYEEAWSEIKAVLLKEPDLHWPTVVYWSRVDGDPDEHFRPTLAMRDVLAAIDT
jgi:hypothetical protein